MDFGRLISCYLDLKLNLSNTQGGIDIWLKATVNNSTITISKIFGDEIKLLP